MQEAGAKLGRHRVAGGPLNPGRTVLRDPPRNVARSSELQGYLDDVERRRILAALEQARWNKTKAAKLLGITFRALRYRLQKLDIEA